MTKKEIATLFLNLVGTGKVQEGFAKFVAPHFIHHNPYFEGSREALVSAMELAHQTSPNIAITVEKCFEVNENVITHSSIMKVDMELVAVHIFKFENDKIVELWDIVQVVDSKTINQNGLF